MGLTVVCGDITQMKAEAIVNAANESLLGGGGVDGAIHKAAGNGLLEECKTLCGCKTGEAKITKGYLLPAKYIIHTVGPVWRGGNQGEPELLAACYENSLRLAVEHNLNTIAFPAISTGVYGFPKTDAAKIAIAAAQEFLKKHDVGIIFVAYNLDDERLYQDLLGNTANMPKSLP